MNNYTENFKINSYEDISSIYNLIIKNNNVDDPMDDENQPSQEEIDHLISLLKEKKIDQLITEVNENKFKYPKSYQLYFLKGLALKEKEEVHNAIVEFEKSMFLNKEFYECGYELANLYSINENYDSAIKVYEDTLKVVPQNSKILNNLGISYLLTSNYKKAYLCFKKALKYNYDYELAFNNMIDSSKHLGLSEDDIISNQIDFKSMTYNEKNFKDIVNKIEKIILN